MMEVLEKNAERYDPCIRKFESNHMDIPCTAYFILDVANDRIYLEEYKT